MHFKENKVKQINLLLQIFRRHSEAETIIFFELWHRLQTNVSIHMTSQMQNLTDMMREMWWRNKGLLDELKV